MMQTELKLSVHPAVYAAIFRRHDVARAGEGIEPRSSDLEMAAWPWWHGGTLASLPLIPSSIHRPSSATILSPPVPLA